MSRRPRRGARRRDAQRARLPKRVGPRRGNVRLAEGGPAGGEGTLGRDGAADRRRAGRTGSQLRRHAELSQVGGGVGIQVRSGIGRRREIEMAVEFGVLIPTREAVMSGRPETAPLLTMAERAEAAGFDSVWIGDSLIARPRHEPLTLLAAVAGRTRRVRLGTGVLLPALRNPVVLAHIVGTLDRAAEGRLILGVGFAADNPSIRKEFAAAGVPFERRIGRFLETLEICQALWRRGHVSFSGKPFPLQDATLEPKPHRPGGPPIWIGGSGPPALRGAARLDPRVSTGPSGELFAQHLPGVQHPAAAPGRAPAP